MIELFDFSENHVEQAMRIAKANYEEERKLVPALPPVDMLPDLTCFAKFGFGSAAFEQGQMVGFLCFFPPIDNAFGTTNVKGTFSPIHAHGTVKVNRGKIYSNLYQAAGEKLVKSGILSHSIALYAHDYEAKDSFFINGFGLRCADAIRPLSPLTPNKTAEFNFTEVPNENKGILTELYNLLIDHLGSSPCFMPFPQLSETEFAAEKDKADIRYFAALIDGKAVAYIKVGDEGENFVCDEPKMLNICGACCLPEYRGTGLVHNLLLCLVRRLSQEGCTRLGVDFETFNPTARGFWLKHFTAYTGGVVRRIDDKIIRRSV